MRVIIQFLIIVAAAIIVMYATMTANESPEEGTDLYLIDSLSKVHPDISREKLEDSLFLNPQIE